MHYKNVAFFLLSVPFLTQAGLVHSSNDVSHTSPYLASKDSKTASKALVARADDEDVCDGTDKCRDNGQRLWDALQATLKDDNAQDQTRWDDPFKNDYTDAPTRDTQPDARCFQDQFKKINIDYRGHFAQHSIRAKTGTYDAFTQLYNTNQGVITSSHAFKNDDPTNTVPLSEIIFQCYRNECDDISELKKFQLAAVENVINDAYLRVVIDIYEKKGLKSISQDWVRWTYKDNKDDFLALLGTPKLGFVLRMLNDHSVAFDKRIPTAVWTNKLRRAVYVTIDKYDS
ncbi:MAG: hypothetical protein Q9224_004723 [Gallowayella concinna]